jgi:hypothetical protein
MGRIRVTVDTGYVGCDHVEEFEAPEEWDEMTEKERDEFLTESENIGLANHIEVYAEYLEG